MKNMIGIRGKRGIFDVEKVADDSIYFCFCIHDGGMWKQWQNKWQIFRAGNRADRERYIRTEK